MLKTTLTKDMSNIVLINGRSIITPKLDFGIELGLTHILIWYHRSNLNVKTLRCIYYIYGIQHNQTQYSREILI